MHFEKRKKKDGTTFFIAVDEFVDPLTGKRRRATVSFKTSTPRGRAQARRELDDKITGILADLESTKEKRVETYTFGQLTKDWFNVWVTTVKPQTVEREQLIINRLSRLIADDVLVKNITPLLVKNCLEKYQRKYGSSFATMQHIKSTLNKIFDYGVLYNILPFSPSQIVKLKSSVADKVAKKKRLERKFLDEREIKVLIAELKKRRNPAYLDLTLFLIGTGCRIGEATALTREDFDFDKNLVSIESSLQTHDLKVDDYYLDTTKTAAGERVEEVPEFAIQAVKRCVTRNEAVDKHHRELPSSAFHFSDVVFRTEYGSPISSHSFRELLSRITAYLQKNCVRLYGFEWKKNVVPHSFRHIHISILRSDPSVPLKEVQERVGHVEEETTDDYTHRLTHSQKKSVSVIDSFATKIGINNNNVENNNVENLP
ncbi:site-specific integrase [Levilactobacillus brevis]|uniref:site-specific integrase n=1 Tax=Levilactobacillus brevis TaxID=1580 RepID=UPI001BDEB7BF|nr:site-specific integrase [Levilactobacillus brevis]